MNETFRDCRGGEELCTQKEGRSRKETIQSLQRQKRKFGDVLSKNPRKMPAETPRKTSTLITCPHTLSNNGCDDLQILLSKLRTLEERRNLEFGKISHLLRIGRWPVSLRVWDFYN